MATDPSNPATVSRKAPSGVSPPASLRDTSVGMTLASVVISGAMRRLSAAFRSAKLSTSPLSAATTYGPFSSPISTLSSGCVLAWEMMPTDAHRV
jgi:hypothetical protein